MNEPKLKIWKLHECANEYCSFLPHDLEFFDKKFECKSLRDNWSMPPAEILNRSKPVGDFISWMSMAPVVIERARALIQNLVGDDAEFLEFHGLKGNRCFVMNVLRCEDYLDMEKSDLTEFRERFFFKKNLPQFLPPIFKCPNRRSEIFVTTDFAEMMVSNKLRGAALADPGEPTMSLILTESPINRYLGVLP